VAGLVTNTSPKSISDELVLINGYLPTALSFKILWDSPSTSKMTVATITEAYLGVKCILKLL
jgi:hypothetical protein